jgi:large subunit ribosomal protein L13
MITAGATTKSTKESQIIRAWHLIDLKDETLGRAATKIALLLMGKSKPYFVRNLDCGDFVVVINARIVKVTGKKEEKKTYARHSGYPGGFRSETLRELRGRRPEAIIVHAVKGMLPDNRLKDKVLRRLFVFADDEHKYKDKFSMKANNVKNEMKV